MLRIAIAALLLLSACSDTCRLEDGDVVAITWTLTEGDPDDCGGETVIGNPSTRYGSPLCGSAEWYDPTIDTSAPPPEHAGWCAVIRSCDRSIVFAEAMSDDTWQGHAFLAGRIAGFGDLPGKMYDACGVDLETCRAHPDVADIHCAWDVTIRRTGFRD